MSEIDIQAILDAINNDNNFDIQSIDTTKLIFNLKIKGKTNDGNIIKGHITADLMQICQDLQDLVYKLYSIAQYGTGDKRKLNAEEKEMLTILFQVNEGCTEALVAFNSLLKTIISLPMKTQLTILAGVTIVCSAWFYNTYQDSKLQQHQNENQTQLLQNYHELSKAQLELFRENSYKNLKTSKLNIEEEELPPQTINAHIKVYKACFEKIDKMAIYTQWQDRIN